MTGGSRELGRYGRRQVDPDAYGTAADAAADRPGEGKGGAVIDPTGRYRYRLERTWNPEAVERGAVVWIMLNPSTATADVDDPTIRRCVAFSRRWWYGSLVVVNLFAYRATEPKALEALTREEAIGPENDSYLAHAIADAGRVVCAWGHRGRLHGRHLEVLALCRQHATGTVYALELIRHGQPKHPLYARGDRPPLIYDRASPPTEAVR